MYAQQINDWSTGNAAKVHDTRAVNNGQWRHIAVTSTGSANASGITIYVDGVPGTSTKVIDLNALNGTITNSQTVNIGARQGNDVFNGTLDEVAIYPTALSAAQIAAHVNARSQTSSTITSIDTFDGAYRNAVLDDKASGYWRLGEPVRQSGAGQLWRMTGRQPRSVRRLADVTRLTIEVDDKVAQRVAEAAAERGVAPEQLASEAVAERFAGRKLAFAAIGASGSTRGAAEADELLAEGFGR